MSQPKPKTMNVFVSQASYVQVDGDEIHVDLRCWKRPAKGSKDRLGSPITIRLILDPYDVTGIAEAGAQGLRKLKENAEALVVGRQGWLERLKRIAGAA